MSQVWYIHSNMGRMSFFELGHSYITALVTTIEVNRIALNWKKEYHEVGREFVEEIHLYHHRNMSEYAMQMHKQVHKICTFFANYLHILMIVGCSLFNGAPFIHNVTHGLFSGVPSDNGTFTHCAYYELPFDYTTKIVGYLAVFIMNLFLTYDAGSSICVFDLYLSLIIFHIWGHLKILDHHLRNFPLPKKQEGQNVLRYSDEEERKVSAMLKDNINHHRLIMKFVQKNSDAFGSMLCVYFAFHQLCCCILLLQCSRLDQAALMEYGGLTMIVFQQLMQISFVFEFLGSRSESLKDAVYSLPWECMGICNRRVVLFLLQNVQTPIALKALGLVPVGVQTMAGILKTSVSYFVMLRTMSSE